MYSSFPKPFFNNFLTPTLGGGTPFFPLFKGPHPTPTPPFLIPRVATTPLIHLEKLKKAW